MGGHYLNMLETPTSLKNDPFYCETPKIPRLAKKTKLQENRPARVRWKLKGEKTGPLYQGTVLIQECIPCRKRA